MGGNLSLNAHFNRGLARTVNRTGGEAPIPGPSTTASWEAPPAAAAPARNTFGVRERKQSNGR